MKKIILLSLILSMATNAKSQTQSVDDRFYFYAQALTVVNEYVIDSLPGRTRSIFHPLKFFIVNDDPITIGGKKYFVISFYKIENEGRWEEISKEKGDSSTSNETIWKWTGMEAQSKNGSVMLPLKGHPYFINSNDNGRFFLIEASKLSDDGTTKSIVKTYRRFSSNPFSYGANITTPFKLRPAIGTRNYTFSPEVAVGGYLGLKIRLSKTEPIYINLPIVTLGFNSISINDQAQQTADGKDGVAWGISWSAGTIAQIYDFQVGFLWGHDYVSGDIGKNWLYNEMPWYSFSIGYSFLGGSKKDEKKAEKEENEIVSRLEKINTKLDKKESSEEIKSQLTDPSLLPK